VSRLSDLLRRPTITLALVAAAYAVVELTLLGVHIQLGWDETIYTSQVIHHAPALDFGPPRARGVTLVAAPLALFGYSLTALRIWLILASTAALFGAFWVWLRVMPDWRVPFAAACFASLWATLLYGQEVMPNFWVAVGAVAAAGFLARALMTPTRGAFGGAALCLGWACLVRPTDGLCIAAGLAAVATITALRRRLGTWLALGTGLAIGWVPWVVEAFVRFGGPINRLHLASQQERGGLTFSLGTQARSVVGPLLCRPCGPSHGYRPLWLVWWVVGTLLVAVGLFRARGPVERPATFMAFATGATLLASYIFTIPYGAPRFLLPTYALFAIPAAVGARAVLQGLSRRALPLAAVAVAVFATQFATQIYEAGAIGRATYLERTTPEQLALDVNRIGVRTNCSVVGPLSSTLAFSAGCEQLNPRLAVVKARAGGALSREITDETVVGVFRFTLPANSPLRGWCKRTPAVEPSQAGWNFYFPPGQLGCPATKATRHRAGSVI
jgi:hypothetical protein